MSQEGIWGHVSSRGAPAQSRVPKRWGRGNAIALHVHGPTSVPSTTWSLSITGHGPGAPHHKVTGGL